MAYKWCVVPQCTNTSIKTPEKLFVSVPNNTKRRKIWLKLAKRDPNSILPHTNVFMCEDHFDMEKATTNYIKYKMGFSKYILLTKEAVPTKFQCHEDHNSNRLSDPSPSRVAVLLNRHRIDFVPECLQNVDSVEESLQNQNATETCIKGSHTVRMEKISMSTQTMVNANLGPGVIQDDPITSEGMVEVKQELGDNQEENITDDCMAEVKQEIYENQDENSTDDERTWTCSPQSVEVKMESMFEAEEHNIEDGMEDVKQEMDTEVNGTENITDYECTFLTCSPYSTDVKVESMFEAEEHNIEDAYSLLNMTNGLNSSSDTASFGTDKSCAENGSNDTNNGVYLNEETIRRQNLLLGKYSDESVISAPGYGETVHSRILMKEMETRPGLKMKVYYCENCHAYAKVLEQMKQHPCETVFTVSDSSDTEITPAELERNKKMEQRARQYGLFDTSNIADLNEDTTEGRVIQYLRLNKRNDNDPTLTPDLDNTNDIIDLEEETTEIPDTQYLLLDKHSDNGIKTTPGFGETIHRRVVMKEIESTLGNNMNVYYCETCHAYAKTLDKMKEYLCETVYTISDSSDTEMTPGGREGNDNHKECCKGILVISDSSDARSTPRRRRRNPRHKE